MRHINLFEVQAKLELTLVLFIFVQVFFFVANTVVLQNFFDSFAFVKGQAHHLKRSSSFSFNLVPKADEMVLLDLIFNCALVTGLRCFDMIYSSAHSSMPTDDKQAAVAAGLGAVNGQFVFGQNAQLTRFQLGLN
ncbi:hypothetical protein BpHYR1_026849 [Brachionus plicatilis]|uniref:Uncharacterized protein n=1 Tax=Brachionus plicatilis TaxID=10195 RepID=A0A3M7S6Q4_BRAPC|nr:hypothetical protein BpHYR1_026849 [Brachionus plicatilis]